LTWRLEQAAPVDPTGSGDGSLCHVTISGKDAVIRTQRVGNQFYASVVWLNAVAGTTHSMLVMDSYSAAVADQRRALAIFRSVKFP
jgi:hypothetical protein